MFLVGVVEGSTGVGKGALVPLREMTGGCVYENHITKECSCVNTENSLTGLVGEMAALRWLT